MKNFSIIAPVAWILLTVVCLYIIFRGLRLILAKTTISKKQQTRILAYVIAGSVGWTVFLLILSSAGFFADFRNFPPRPLLVLFIPLPVLIGIAFSKTGTVILQSIPAHWLIYMQSFRVAVELLLLMAFLNGKIPVQMTFEGLNFDILTGLLAIPAGYLVSKSATYSRTVAIIYNFIGLVLLINILAIAVLSMPTPMRQFMNDPANTLVAEFPFILLPGVLVPLAYGLHIFSLRKIFERKPQLHMQASS